MHLFFQIRRRQLLKFCMMAKNLWPVLVIFIYIFFGNIIKVNHFSIFLLYCYVKFLLFYILNLCLFRIHIFYRFNWLYSFIIIWTSNNLVNFFSEKLCLSLLNPCCIFNIDLLLFRNSWWFSLILYIILYYILHYNYNYIINYNRL